MIELERHDDVFVLGGQVELAVRADGRRLETVCLGQSRLVIVGLARFGIAYGLVTVHLTIASPLVSYGWPMKSR